MSDLLSFLEMFFHGLNLVFIWVFFIISVIFMFYVGVTYLFNCFFLIPMGLLKRDKYFVAGAYYDFLNNYLWRGKVTEYKEYYLQVCLFEFYRCLAIFNSLCILYSFYLVSNMFFPLSFSLIFLFCLFKAYIFYKKRAVAKDKLNKYYESIYKITGMIT